MSQKYQYNTIEEALRDLREGKVILVTDDPNRENEGDLICAAEFATQENINFMADLYTNECGDCSGSEFSSDGCGEYR